MERGPGGGTRGQWAGEGWRPAGRWFGGLQIARKNQGPEALIADCLHLTGLGAWRRGGLASGDPESTQAVVHQPPLGLPAAKCFCLTSALPVPPCIILLCHAVQVDWHKGTALNHLMDVLGLRGQPDVAAIYIGDDHTDEDAFRTLRESQQGGVRRGGTMGRRGVVERCGAGAGGSEDAEQALCTCLAGGEDAACSVQWECVERGQGLPGPGDTNTRGGAAGAAQPFGGEVWR